MIENEQQQKATDQNQMNDWSGETSSIQGTIDRMGLSKLKSAPLGWFLLGSAAGTMIAYLFDPRAGKGRRNSILAKGRHIKGASSSRLSQTFRGFQDRVRGTQTDLISSDTMSSDTMSSDTMSTDAMSADAMSGSSDAGNDSRGANQQH